MTNHELTAALDDINSLIPDAPEADIIEAMRALRPHIDHLTHLAHAFDVYTHTLDVSPDDYNDVFSAIVDIIDGTIDELRKDDLS